MIYQHCFHPPSITDIDRQPLLQISLLTTLNVSKILALINVVKYRGQPHMGQNVIFGLFVLLLHMVKPCVRLAILSQLQAIV